MRLPKAQLANVTEGGRPLSSGDGIAHHTQDGDSVVVEIGSGLCRFA